MSTYSTKRFSSTGDEIQKRTRADKIGDHEHQIHQNRDHGGIDKAGPEISSGRFARYPGDDLTQLEKLDDHDDRGVDRAPCQQIGGERKIVEPDPQRPIQHEQLDAPDRNAHQQPVGYPHRQGGWRGAPLNETDPKSRDRARHNDDGEQSQLSFEPCVHDAPPA
jgi:hypothetical protein